MIKNKEAQLDPESVKNLFKAFTKELPDLKHFTNFGLKKMKDMENTGNIIFEKYQQNTLDRKAKQKKFTWAMEKNKSTILNKLQNFRFSHNCGEDEKVNKYRELLRQEKQAFIEQSKIVSQAEVENKILKNYYRKALANVRNEIAKILTSDKSFQKFASKINQSDSVHVNPAFGGSSGRKDVKSQNSFSHPNNELEFEANNNAMHSNFLNINNYHNLHNNKETSGFIGNNISGTTGGDDDPVLKFNNMLRKSGDKKEISGQTLKKLSKLQELVMKYQQIPFKKIFNSKMYKNYAGMNTEINFNKTISQDSINQAFTSFFGYSDLKDPKEEFSCFNSGFLKLGKESKNSSDKEIQKDSSFSLARDFEIGPQFEVLKEIKEEIKEESLRRRQPKKNTLTLTFEEGTPKQDSGKCDFSEFSEIKDDTLNQ